MAYSDFKDLPRRTTVDKVFREKQICYKSKNDGYQLRLVSMG